MAERRCSECGRPLGPHAPINRKTCSGACRSKRSRRMARNAKKRGKAAAHPPELAALAGADRGKIEDAAMEVMREEVRPVVREALTEEVLRSIQDLVNLTPTIVDKIKEDIEQTDDKMLRQRAYTLVAKYTLGNPSVAPQPEQSGQQLIVNFAMPRPGDESPAEIEAPEVVEVKKCMECHEEKPSTEFVANSDRCARCHEQLQSRVRERFGGGE